MDWISSLTAKSAMVVPVSRFACSARKGYIDLKARKSEGILYGRYRQDTGAI